MMLTDQTRAGEMMGQRQQLLHAVTRDSMLLHGTDHRYMQLRITGVCS